MTPRTEIYYRIRTHIHEGIGPGFADCEVIDGLELSWVYQDGFQCIKLPELPE